MNFKSNLLALSLTLYASSAVAQSEMQSAVQSEPPVAPSIGAANSDAPVQQSTDLSTASSSSDITSDSAITKVDAAVDAAENQTGSIKIPYRKPVDSTGRWDQLESKGEKASYNCEYGEAERLLKGAVRQARNFPAGDLRLAKSDGELGKLLTIRGRFAEAEPYMEEELAVKTAASGNEDEHLIPAMAALVRFYLLHGTASKADPLAEKVLSFVEGKLDEAAQAKGKMTLQAGQPLQAWAGQASQVMRDPLIEWAIACDEIGTIYSTRENFPMAERLFKAALTVKSTVLGAHHLSLANSYDSLGTLSLARKDYESAEQDFKDALDITERIQPPENFQVWGRLDKLGKCLIQENKIAEAEALYLRAQDLWKNEPCKNGNDGRAAFALANIYAQQKKYAEAAPLFEKALRVAEAGSGPDSVSIVPYLDRYAYCLYYLGNREQTDELRARAQAITDGNTSQMASRDAELPQ